MCRSRRTEGWSTAKGTCSISRMNDRQSLHAFLMSAQISRSGKTLNRRQAEGCNDSIAGRARSAIINAQLETGACGLIEREQQRLAAPRTRRSQLVRYLCFAWHADAPNCATRSAPQLRLLGLAGLLRDFSYRAKAGSSPTASGHFCRDRQAVCGLGGARRRPAA
jgi:hypothetical protein